VRQGLDRLAVGAGVADGGIAGHGFQGVQRPLVRPAYQAALRPTVLVAQRNLQVEDLFAVALEAEVARLDDAGVDRADRDLVDLLALDTVILGDADHRRLARRPAPGVAAA